MTSSASLAARVREDSLPPQIDFQHSRIIALDPMPFHYHQIYEVYYSKTEGMSYLVGNRIYELEPGDLLVLNNFDIHHSLPVKGKIYERWLILFPPELMKPRSHESTDLLECFRNHNSEFNHRRHLSKKEQVFFESLMKKGKEAMGINQYGSDVERRIILEEALLFINRVYRRDISHRNDSPLTHGNRDLARIGEIMEYVDRHIGEDLSLLKLAQKFNSTSNGLNRLFKKNGVYTVHQYILNRRIQYARLFLSEGRQVTSVAYDVGYQDLTHFIRIFKEKTGMTPGQYRKQCLESPLH